MEDLKFTRKQTQDNFITEKLDVLENNLLGSYDDNGNYFISSQIIDELINMPKYKKESFGNSMFCIGNLLGYGEIAFELDFQDKLSEDGFAKATLYLLEDVDKINGYMQNVIKTNIAEFTSEDNDYVEQTIDHFNISTNFKVDEDDDEGMERKIIDDLDGDSFILAKKQYSLLLEKLIDEKYLDAYGKFFTAKLSTLSAMDNDFSRDVMDLFNNEYNSIEKYFLKDKNYKILNELLDKCLEELSGTKSIYLDQESEFYSQIEPALKLFTESVNNLEEKYSNKALKMLDKSDREKVETLMNEMEYRNNENDTIEFEEEPIVEEFVEQHEPDNAENEIEEELDTLQYIMNKNSSQDLEESVELEDTKFEPEIVDIKASSDDSVLNADVTMDLGDYEDSEPEVEEQTESTYTSIKERMASLGSKLNIRSSMQQEVKYEEIQEIKREELAVEEPIIKDVNIEEKKEDEKVEENILEEKAPEVNAFNRQNSSKESSGTFGQLFDHLSKQTKNKNARNYEDYSATSEEHNEDVVDPELARIKALLQKEKEREM